MIWMCDKNSNGFFFFLMIEKWEYTAGREEKEGLEAGGFHFR